MIKNLCTRDLLPETLSEYSELHSTCLIKKARPKFFIFENFYFLSCFEGVFGEEIAFLGSRNMKSTKNRM